MNIKPVASPHAINPGGQADFAKAQVTRANAIAAFSGQPAQPVVQNQTQVSVEEMGAIIPQQNQHSAQQTRQSLTNDTSVDDITPSIPEPNVGKPESEPEDPTLSRQFAQLARQERSLRAKAQQQAEQLKAEKAAFAIEKAALEAEKQKYTTGYVSKDQLKQNAIQTLLDQGLSYDDLTQQVMNLNNPLDPRVESHISKLQATVDSLTKKLEESSNQSKQSQESARQTAVKQIRSDVDSIVSNDPNYETIKHTGSQQDVVDLIVRTYDKTGVTLSAEEAAEEVENYILEEAVKLSQLKKVSARRPLAVPQAPAPTQKTQASTKPQTPAPTMRTLTNATASTRPLTAKERAILAFKGELK